MATFRGSCGPGSHLGQGRSCFRGSCPCHSRAPRKGKYEGDMGSWQYSSWSSAEHILHCVAGSHSVITASGMAEQRLEFADETPVPATVGNGGLMPYDPGAVEEWLALIPPYDGRVSGSAVCPFRRGVASSEAEMIRPSEGRLAYECEIPRRSLPKSHTRTRK